MAAGNAGVTGGQMGVTGPETTGELVWQGKKTGKDNEWTKN